MKAIQCADGGQMIEVYRDEGWGQLNVRVIPPGAKAGGHRHPNTDEWWFLARGENVLVTLEERGYLEDSGRFRLRPQERLRVSAGQGHAVENAGDEDAVLVFWRSLCYDEANPDKEAWDPDAGA